MDAWTVSTSTATLIRSTDDGVTWSTVWTSPANGKYILGPQGVVRDEATGHLYLPEYDTNPAHTTIDIWRSTDKGATWAVWVSMPRSTSIEPGAILHWHSARYDHVSQRVYFLAGDHQADAGIYRTNDAGDGIEPVVLNKQTSALSAAASRAVDIMFFPTHIAWPVDGSGGGQNHVYRMARDQIGAANPVVEKVAAIDNNGWWCIPARNDKSMWLFTTSTEWPSSTNSDEGLVHMYAVSDNGGTVDEVAVVNVDGQRTAFASVSGFSGYAGSGDSFWLRAHTHRMFPNTGTSSFQLRARLGFGVVPLIRPAPKSFSYGQQSRSTPPVSLAPGESRAFAFAYVPKRTKALSIFDVGSLGMNPLTYGATKVEIWNVTTNTKAYEHVGPSVLTSTNSDTAHRQTVIHFNPMDVIEFRVTNIHASATVGCAAYVEFGWSFS